MFPISTALDLIGFSRTEEQVQGVLKNLFECLQELRAYRAINHAMIAGHRHAHHLSNLDFVLGTIGLGFIAPTARIAASGGLITAVNSSMPNMPRLLIEKVAPMYSSGFSFRVAGTAGQFPHFSRDVQQRFHIGGTNYRRDQSVLSRDRDADVRVLVVPHGLVLK